MNDQTPMPAMYGGGKMGRWTEDRTRRAWEAHEKKVAGAPDETTTHPGDLIDAHEAGEHSGPVLAEAQAHVLVRILVWINKAATPERRGHRVWVVTYLIRPELSRIQAANAYAKACGVSRQAIDDLVKDFRSQFPDVTWPSKVRGNGRRGGAGRERDGRWSASDGATPGKESPAERHP